MSAKQNFFSGQINDLANHSVEATVSILGFNNPIIRNHLIKELNIPKQSEKHMDTLIGNPVFDVLFPWEGQDKEAEQLIDLLHPKIIKGIQKPYKHQLESWELLSSNHTGPKSLVVTSGTGSGKTECFMIPIIDSLVRDQQKTKQQLQGVQALFLYPLNALINSQKDRLDEWTKDFKENIRFCLYNGLTPETHAQQKPNQVQSREVLRESPPPILVTNATMLEYMLIRQKDQDIIKKSQGKLRWIVLDEAHSYLGSTASELSLLLRRVMIAFGVDAKNVHFIATSATIGEDEEAKRKLVDFLSGLSGAPRNHIHVITAQRHVPVIESSSTIIDTSTPTLTKVADIESGEYVSLSRYKALAEHSFANIIRNQFIQPNGKTCPQSLNDLLVNLGSQLDAMLDLEKTNHTKFEKTDHRDYLLKWLDIASYTKPCISDEEPAFLPLRAHVFQRTLNGLYACANPDCNGKHMPYSNLDQQTNDIPDWPFGYIYGNTRKNCMYCNSPVYELVFCQDCQTPHLLAMDDSKHIGNLKLKHFSRIKKDEFSLDEIIDDESTTTQPDSSDLENSPHPILLMPPFFTKQLSSRVNFDKDTEISNSFSEMFLSKSGIVLPTEHEDTVPVFLQQPDGKESISALNHCYFCDASAEKQTILKPINLGAPFYMSEVAPKLLDYCEPYSGTKNSLPYHGKRMITFTDSRQGTARITMKLRQDSERRTLRHIVYSYLAQKTDSNALTDEEIQNNINQIQILEHQIAQLLNNPLMEVTVNVLRNQIEKIQNNINTPVSSPLISWQDMLTNIRTDNEFDFLKESMARIASINNITDSNEIAELLLLNELARRPRNANSLETLGLVYLSYPQLINVKLSNEELSIWQDFGFEQADWQDYLKLLMDFYIRENKFVNLSFDQINSVSERFFGKLELVAPDADVDFDHYDNKYIRPWLQVNSSSPNRSQRLIKLLALPNGINLANKINKDKINTLLKKAWEQLIDVGLLIRSTRRDLSTYQFDFRSASLTIPNQVYICPVSYRLLDTTLKGFTPYLPHKQNLLQLIEHAEKYQCDTIDIPIFKPDPHQVNYTQQANYWLKTQPVIQDLRKKNLWTDISDSVIAGMNTIVTEEHSAQIKQKSLEQYEKRFKDGEINILNCSTTMEMGVDIGGISSVAMNNVPPHPANYLQRTGRAGRRSESQAIAFTICKNNPHEQMVFSHTRWAFDTKIQPPYITLNSQKIIQRHINAYLLGLFLTQQSKHMNSNITLKSGWFFLHWLPENINKSYLESIINNLPEQEDHDQWHSLFTNDTPYLSMQNWLEKLLLQDSQSGEKNLISGHIKAIVNQSAFINLPVENFIRASIDNLYSMKRYTINKTIAKLKEFKEIKLSRHSQTGYLNKLTIDIKGIANAYLLADLAKFGFLPRYGFPSGVVEFDIYNSANFKDQRYKNRDETQDFTNGKPTRDLAVALREYAPGNEVAVDGLVYKSAGLELSQYLNHSQNNDAQILQYFGQCQSCGAIEYYDDERPNCIVCRAEIRDSIRFVEPMGFKVDYITKPHTKIEKPTFVPVQEPKIQANTAVTPLPNPEIGSYQIDSDGKIFHYSSGTHGNGYFVCLHCGRAESARYDKKTQFEAFEMQKIDFMDNHIPLKPLKELKELKEANADKVRGACSINGKFNIQHMHIGAADTTNVFELRLKDPKTQHYFDDSDENKVLLTTLAVVFREALAQCHGINADELGCGIKPLRINGEKVNTIFIYDKASGGAGFSSIANKFFSEMFEKAEALLDCPDNCESACHSCLIDYDTRFISDQLDRNVAKAYFEAIKPMLNLPNEAKIIPGAQYCSNTIVERVAESLNQDYDKIFLFLQGDPKDWEFGTLYERLKLWEYHGICVQISFNKLIINELPEGIKSNLLHFSGKKGVELAYWVDENNKYYLDSKYLLQMTQKQEGRSLTIATTDRQSYVSNLDFWKVDDNEFVVESSIAPIQQTTLFTQEEINMFLGSQSNAFWTSIDKQPKASNLEEIGKHILNKILENDQLLTSLLQKRTKIRNITYEDRYIFPLQLLVIDNFIKALLENYPDTHSKIGLVLETLYQEPKLSSRENFGKLEMKWPNNAYQERVINRYLKSAIVEPDCRIKNKTEHDRTLKILWDDDLVKETQITIGHGFGFIKPEESKRYNSYFTGIKDEDSFVTALKDLKLDSISLDFTKTTINSQHLMKDTK